MYWPDFSLEHDKFLRRDKEFPPAAKAPELNKKVWSSQGYIHEVDDYMLDVNFCYNTMCGNFGLSHTRAKDRGKPYEVRRKGNLLMLVCPECGLTRKIYNNEAVDAMFLHVLKNNLTHDYCQNEKCHNYRMNLHEYYGDFYNPVDDVPTDPDELKDYKYLVKCPLCTRQFAAGTPWRIHDRQERTTQSGKVQGRPFPVSPQVFMKLVCNGVGPSSMIELTECNPGDYYTLLHNLAQSCNMISGRHLMELQSVRYAKFVNDAKDDNTVRLYSDMMEISILVDDKLERVRQLSCLITVTDYRDSFFALAATPMFIPMKPSRLKMKRLRAKLMHESHYLEAHQTHAHLLSDEALTDYAQQPGTRRYTYPILGLDGFFVQDGYGALAHFLALRKMLSDIDRVIHYVDNENTLEMSAVTAFADRIKEEKCEVVTVRIDSQKKLKRSKTAPPSYKKPDDADTRVKEAVLREHGETEGAAKQKDKPLTGKELRQAGRREQMLGLVSRLPDSMAEAGARQTAVREAQETVRDARAVLRQITKVYRLPHDIFLETRKRSYTAKNLAALPDEIRDMAEALTKRVNEVAALTKEVDALAGKVEDLTDETPSLAGDVDRLAEKATRHSNEELERPERQQDPNDLAYAYRLGVNKAVSEAGLDLWVLDEYAPTFEPNRRFMWLTRRSVPENNLTGEAGDLTEETRELFDKEVELYLYGKHQPADTYMSSLRQLASTAERARLIAAVRHGAGYVSSPRLPTSIISELALHRFRWNFMRRRREKRIKRNITRAFKLGLDVPRALTVNDASTARSKVYEWAQKIADSIRGTEDDGAHA